MNNSVFQPNLERDLAEILLKKPMIILDPRDINNGIVITNHNIKLNKVNEKNGVLKLNKKVANFIPQADSSFHTNYNYHFAYDLNKHKLFYKFYFEDDQKLKIYLIDSQFISNKIYFYHFMKINMLNLALNSLIEQEKTGLRPTYPYSVQKEIIEKEISKIKEIDPKKQSHNFSTLSVEDKYLFALFFKSLIKEEKRKFLLKEL